MKLCTYLFALSIIFGSCRKEYPPGEPAPVTPGDSTPVSIYVPIYQPGDTTFGAAEAKKLTATWRARAYSQTSDGSGPSFVNKYFINFTTVSALGTRREFLGLSFIFKNQLSQFELVIPGIPVLPPGSVVASYHTYQSDGETIQDTYVLDTTATDNFLNISKFDTISKRVEGTFTATFNIREPRQYAGNPKQVKFSNGRFWSIMAY